MEKEQRSAIERATQRSRRGLEADFVEQLDAVFDIRVTGVAAEAGAHLDPGQREIRDKLVAAVEHKRAGGMNAPAAVLDFVRDLAFTTLNRFVALKMLEARELVLECVSRGEESSGYKEFCGLAAGVALLPNSGGYRLYLECLFDELSTEVKVLFDRRDPAALLWPRRATFDALLADLNHPDLGVVWKEDETIGWVYQYFNSGEERRAMRDASQAPRNSRELAIRNQFFTPRYVVQFLVDNTLGRIWFEMRRGQTALAACDYLVRAKAEMTLGDPDVQEPEWLRRVAGGDFTAIPEGLTFVDSQPFAQLIDGYQESEALGLGSCGELANAISARHRESGVWSGTPAELWLCLFFTHRSYRHYGQNPDDPETLAELDGLCRALRAGLIADPRAVTLSRPRAKKDPRDLAVLDPACGSGHFLLAAFDHLVTIYAEAWADPDSPPSEITGRRLAEDYPGDTLAAALPGLILAHNLHGVDIDPRCAQIAQLALWMRAQRAFQEAGVRREGRPPIRRSNIVVAESMPSEPGLLAEFTAALDPPLLGELFRQIVAATRLAGEMGLLLRLERTLARAVGEAKAAYLGRQRKRAGFLPGFEPIERQNELDFSGITDDSAFFDHAEALLRRALDAFGDAASGHSGVRRRLFAGDAIQGLGLVERCERKYDVVLMNPPFGAGSAASKRDFEAAYPMTKNDVYAAFVERGIELLHPRSRLGAITSRTGFFLSSFQKWREDILLAKAPPVVFADLGAGVLDAMVETAAFCLEASWQSSTD